MMKSPALVALVSFFTLIGSVSVTEAAWPEKPIRIIVPWRVGGSTDIMARVVSTELSQRLNQPVIVDNRPGAGGIVGMQIAAQTAPEGYNFMVTSTAYGYLIYQSRSKGVDLIKSFAPVALLGFGDAGLVVPPNLPVNSVKELIALAKSKPGQLNYASSGIGGFPHLSTELFKLRTGVDIVHVPYQNAGQALVEVMTGKTQVFFTSLSGKIPQIRSGKLKILAVGGEKRNPAISDIPTISEAGVPGYETRIWWGMFATPRTPVAIIARMHDAIEDILSSPDIAKKLEGQGAALERMTTAEFGTLMVAEQNKWLSVVKFMKANER